MNKNNGFSFFLRWVLLIVLFALSSYFSYQTQGNSLMGTDDANIYFVYAKNVANGHGFVYNIGGEKVEGFTSFFWCLICSFAFRFSAQPEVFLFILNIFVISFAVTKLSYFLETECNPFSRLHFPSFFSTIFLVLWLITNPNYTSWTILSLLETGIWSTILILLALEVFSFFQEQQAKGVTRFCIYLAVLVFSRPESLVWGLCFLSLFSFSAFSKKGDSGYSWWAILAPWFFFFGSIALLIGFRLSYFGYPFPNTYYAKVSPNLMFNILGGIKYFARFSGIYFIGTVQLVASGLFLLAAYLWCNSVEKKGTLGEFLTHEKNYVLGFVITWAGLIIPILSGGDFFGNYRFYQPIVPLMIIPCFFIFRFVSFYTGFPEIPNKLVKSAFLVLMAFAFGIASGMHNETKYFQADTPIKANWEIAMRSRKNGEDLNSFFQGKALPNMARYAAGGIAVTYKGNVVDLLGLNNTKMGHSPGDRTGDRNHSAFNKDVFFDLNIEMLFPELLQEKPAGNPYIPGSEPMAGLVFEQRFKEAYKPVVVKRGEKEFLFAVFKKEFIETLKKDGFQVEVFEHPL